MAAKTQEKTLTLTDAMASGKHIFRIAGQAEEKASAVARREALAKVDIMPAVQIVLNYSGDEQQVAVAALRHALGLADASSNGIGKKNATTPEERESIREAIAKTLPQVARVVRVSSVKRDLTLDDIL